MVYPENSNGPNVNGELFRISLDMPEDIDDLLEKLAQKRYGTKQETDSLAMEKQQLQQEVRDLEEQIERIKGIPEAIGTYKKDLNKMRDFIENMQSHVATNEKTLEQLKGDLEKKMEELRVAREERDNIIKTIKEQMFGLEEMEDARQRQKHFDDEIMNEELAIDELKKNNRLIKLEYTKCDDTINKMHDDAVSWLNALRDMMSTPAIVPYIGPVKSLLEQPVTTELLKSFSTRSAAYEHGRRTREKFSELVHCLKMRVIEQLTALDGCVKTDEEQRINDIDVQLTECNKVIETLKCTREELAMQLENCRKVWDSWRHLDDV